MAIDDLLDEHEQSERVRSWLRQNALGLVGGIALGLALIGGWQWWQARQLQQQAGAGDRFDAMVTALDAGDLAKGKQLAAQLPREGMYATLAALRLARAQVEGGATDEAIATLRGLQNVDPAIAAIVQQRLARLQIDAGKPQEALETLGRADGALALDLRGDALAALGKRDEARDAYAQAYRKTDPGAPARPLLAMKLSDAGGSVPSDNAPTP